MFRIKEKPSTIKCSAFLFPYFFFLGVTLGEGFGATLGAAFFAAFFAIIIFIVLNG